MKEYYKLTITETSEEERENEIGEVDIVTRMFSEFSQTFRTMQECKRFIKDRYDGVEIEATDDNGVYIDVKGESKRIGTTFKYTNRDISHDSEPWTQVDWIQISKVKQETIFPW